MTMTDEEREAIRKEASALLAFFDEAELLVLRTHTRIHRWATRAVAAKREVRVSDLRRITFLSAVREAHGSGMGRNLYEVLEILNDARNIVAHEESPGEIFLKIGEIGRRSLGPGYIESPASFEEAHAQFRQILEDLAIWATHP